MRRPSPLLGRAEPGSMRHSSGPGRGLCAQSRAISRNQARKPPGRASSRLRKAAGERFEAGPGRRPAHRLRVRGALHTLWQAAATPAGQALWTAFRNPRCRKPAVWRCPSPPFRAVRRGACPSPSRDLSKSVTQGLQPAPRLFRPAPSDATHSAPVGGSSNGRTPDSDSGCLGSNPSPPAILLAVVSE